MLYQVKKYKNVLIDKVNNVRFNIYSNKKLNKAQMLQQIRFYFVDKDYTYPEAGNNINIIVEE